MSKAKRPTQPPLGCLRYAGVLGHAYAVVEPSSHWSAVDGWRLAAQTSTLDGAREHAMPGARIYHLTPRGWRLSEATPQRNLGD